MTEKFNEGATLMPEKNSDKKMKHNSEELKEKLEKVMEAIKFGYSKEVRRYLETIPALKNKLTAPEHQKEVAEAVLEGVLHLLEGNMYFIKEAVEMLEILPIPDEILDSLMNEKTAEGAMRLDEIIVSIQHVYEQLGLHIGWEDDFAAITGRLEIPDRDVNKILYNIFTFRLATGDVTDVEYFLGALSKGKFPYFKLNLRSEGVVASAQEGFESVLREGEIEKAQVLSNMFNDVLDRSKQIDLLSEGMPKITKWEDLEAFMVSFMPADKELQRKFYEQLPMIINQIIVIAAHGAYDQKTQERLVEAYVEAEIFAANFSLKKDVFERSILLAIKSLENSGGEDGGQKAEKLRELFADTRSEWNDDSPVVQIR